MTEASMPLVLSALLLGFFGSAHCLAMCGGIAGALGQARTEEGSIGAWARAGLYSTGRIASYAIAGGIVASVGEAFVLQTGWAAGL